MQLTVVVHPLLAISAMNSPKPFSSAADHSVLVIRHGACCALADDATAIAPPNARAKTNESDVRTHYSRRQANLSNAIHHRPAIGEGKNSQ
jgi:hypothetical protein